MDWLAFLRYMAARHGLTPVQTQAFLARIGEEENHPRNEEQAAQHLGIKKNTLKQRMRKVYPKFRQAYPNLSNVTTGSSEQLRSYLEEDYQRQRDTPAPPQPPTPPNIESLVQQIRKQISPKIVFLCGTIRVLGMSQPIALETIFTRVYILTTLRFRQDLEPSNLVDSVSQNLRDRLHNVVISPSKPGLEAVKNHQKLIVLGKPGAGKTTFLKYLAMKCIEEGNNEQTQKTNYLRQFVPLFISLKDFTRDFAEASSIVDLLSYIVDRFELNCTEIELILRQGRALVLLDGLDEIRERERSQIIRQVERFLERWGPYNNKFVITCRTNAVKYSFEQFTEVEVADFGDKQIQEFVKDWFNNIDECYKAKIFFEILHNSQYKTIRELARNPLLLTLLCIVFNNSLYFPTKHSHLYYKAIEILLETWDATRDIERDESYKRLSLQDKENLLNQIAYATFTTNNYIFAQQTVKSEITNYIRRLPSIEGNLQVDEQAVLRSIEVQHGLLVKRADLFYSFSHLTFHEYFTAKYIVNSCGSQSSNSPVLVELMQHITNPTWEEVFLRTAELFSRAEGLLQLMKAQVDKLLAKDSQLQAFLHWVEQKSLQLLSVIGNSYNLAEIRANYFDFDIALDRDRSLGWLLSPRFTRAFTCASFLARARRCEVTDTFLEIPDLSDSHNLEQAMAITSARTRAIEQLLDEVGLDTELGQQLQQLRTVQEQLDQFRTEVEQSFDDSYLTNLTLYEEEVQAWGDKLRQVIVPYHSLGESWRFDRFSSNQKDLLNQYYYANKLLIRCLKRANVDPNVREEIKETLLLPV